MLMVMDGGSRCQLLLLCYCCLCNVECQCSCCAHESCVGGAILCFVLVVDSVSCVM